MRMRERVRDRDLLPEEQQGCQNDLQEYALGHAVNAFGPDAEKSTAKQYPRVEAAARGGSPSCHRIENLFHGQARVRQRRAATLRAILARP